MTTPWANHDWPVEAVQELDRLQQEHRAKVCELEEDLSELEYDVQEAEQEADEAETRAVRSRERLVKLLAAVEYFFPLIELRAGDSAGEVLAMRNLRTAMAEAEKERRQS